MCVKIRGTLGRLILTEKIDIDIENEIESFIKALNRKMGNYKKLIKFVS